MARAASLTTLAFISLLLSAAMGVEVDVAIKKFYLDNACAGPVKVGYPTVEGKCVWNSTGRWAKIVCTESQVTTTYYTDNGCTTVDAGQNAKTVSTTCTETETDGLKMWSSWTCGSKMDVYSMTQFNAAGCSSSTRGPELTPLKKDSCNPDGEVSGGKWTGFSVKFELTLSEIKESRYSSSDCTGNPEVETLKCGNVCTPRERHWYKLDCAPSLGPAATTKATSTQASFSTPAAVPQALFAFAAVSFLTAAL